MLGSSLPYASTSDHGNAVSESSGHVGWFEGGERDEKVCAGRGLNLGRGMARSQRLFPDGHLVFLALSEPAPVLWSKDGFTSSNYYVVKAVLGSQL